MAATTSLTIDDFERLPAEQVENHELVDGQLVPESGRTLAHNLTRDRLTVMLLPIVREGGHGFVVAEQGYDFAGNVHSPDVTFFGCAKLALADPEKRVQRFVPDLAVEIVSPDDLFHELWRKKERYRACGTSEVWIVSPDTREVLIYSEKGDRILTGAAELSTELIPGIRIQLAELFRDL
jgi:Uma2 family endonuclease